MSGSYFIATQYYNKLDFDSYNFQSYYHTTIINDSKENHYYALNVYKMYYFVLRFI